MHKAPKRIQSPWDHPKNIPFVQKYKESAICAILREKTPFWGIITEWLVDIQNTGTLTSEKSKEKFLLLKTYLSADACVIFDTRP